MCLDSCVQTNAPCEMCVQLREGKGIVGATLLHYTYRSCMHFPAKTVHNITNTLRVKNVLGQQHTHCIVEGCTLHCMHVRPPEFMLYRDEAAAAVQRWKGNGRQWRRGGNSNRRRMNARKVEKRGARRRRCEENDDDGGIEKGPHI